MKAGTVVWNGPVGVFEFDQFGEGTKTIAMAIANTKAFTLAGGGDTIAAIQKYDIYDKVSYISTAGGAFLEYPRRQGPARCRHPRTARQGLIRNSGRRTAGGPIQHKYVHRKRTTKIVATLGPASRSPEVLTR